MQQQIDPTASQRKPLGNIGYGNTIWGQTNSNPFPTSQKNTIASSQPNYQVNKPLDLKNLPSINKCHSINVQKSGVRQESSDEEKNNLNFFTPKPEFKNKKRGAGAGGKKVKKDIFLTQKGKFAPSSHHFLKDDDDSEHSDHRVAQQPKSNIEMLMENFDKQLEIEKERQQYQPRIPDYDIKIFEQNVKKFCQEAYPKLQQELNANFIQDMGLPIINSDGKSQETYSSTFNSNSKQQFLEECMLEEDQEMQNIQRLYSTNTQDMLDVVFKSKHDDNDNLQEKIQKLDYSNQSSSQKPFNQQEEPELYNSYSFDFQNLFESNQNEEQPKQGNENIKEEEQRKI